MNTDAQAELDITARLRDGNHLKPGEHITRFTPVADRVVLTITNPAAGTRRVEIRTLADLYVITLSDDHTHADLADDIHQRAIEAVRRDQHLGVAALLAKVLPANEGIHTLHIFDDLVVLTLETRNTRVRQVETRTWPDLERIVCFGPYETHHHDQADRAHQQIVDAHTRGRS